MFYIDANVEQFTCYTWCQMYNNLIQSTEFNGNLIYKTYLSLEAMKYFTNHFKLKPAKCLYKYLLYYSYISIIMPMCLS